MTAAPWAENFSKIVEARLPCLPGAIAAGRSKIWLLEVHAAFARDVAERVALEAPDHMDVAQLAALCARALEITDDFVRMVIVNYESLGIARKDLVAETATVINHNLRQRFGEIIFSPIAGGHA